MFVKPTINDFLDLIDWHISKARQSAEEAVMNMRLKASAAGRLQSGSTVVQSFELTRKEFELGVEAVLGEVKRAARITELDRHQLRDQAMQRLLNFAIAAKAVAQIPEASLSGLENFVTEQCATFDKRLDFLVRQFNAGLFDPVEPEVPPVAQNYNISIGQMTGSAIQQGSPGAKQSVEFNLNVETIKEALAAFETAVTSASLPPDTLADVRADIDTIRAQLVKSTPNRGIIQEAGKSLRHVVEGVVGGMLTTPVTTAVTTAAAMLWSALGIG
jgi:hypothetical protein